MTWPGYDDGRPRCTCGPAPRGPPWDDGSDPGRCDVCEREADDAADGFPESFEALADGSMVVTLDDLEDFPDGP